MCTVLFAFTNNCVKLILYMQIFYIVVQESKNRIFDFYIFQEKQKTKYLLLGVTFIAENQSGLGLVTSKFTLIGVLNFQ